MLTTRPDTGPTPSLLDPLPGTLLTVSRPWPGVSLLDFLHAGAGRPRVYWENENRPLALAGYGRAAVLTARGADRFHHLQTQIDRLFRHILPLQPDTPPEIGPKLFGGFSFFWGEPRTPAWEPFPEAWFLLPRLQLTRSGDQTWLTLNHILQPGEDPAATAARLIERARDICWQGLDSRFAAAILDNGAPPLSKGQHETLMSRDAWIEMVTRARARIRRGALDKVVLARGLRLRFPQPLDVLTALARLQARYPDCYRFLIEPRPGHAFFGATPELLAETRARELRTAALAGSIRRGHTWQEDQALGQQLLDSPKDRHEHDLVVREILHNLQPLVSRLEAPATPQLCLLNNIQHLKTPITARLSDGQGILALIHALHPTPALGGFPRPSALRLIRQLEPLPRGWYGAPVGWLAPGREGLFAVAIRSAVTNPGQALLYAGAGIVADSDPEKEWRETELKFQPVLHALGCV